MILQNSERFLTPVDLLANYLLVEFYKRSQVELSRKLTLGLQQF